MGFQAYSRYNNCTDKGVKELNTMIRYAITVSNNTQEEDRQLTSYGLRAVNEQGEEVLAVPNISHRQEDVAYLVDHFNRVRIKRDKFQ